MRREILERELLAQPVRGLQYMLRRLSEVHGALPRLVPDGIFGEETLEAVMVFQRDFHPPVTGVVDRDTWNAIQEMWEQVEGQIGHTHALRAFPGEGKQVEPGMEEEYMILPQTMFQVLAHHLNGIQEGETRGIHDRTSVENVRWLQQASGLGQSGTLDRETWERLARLYEVMVVRELEQSSRRFIGGWG